MECFRLQSNGMADLPPLTALRAFDAAARHLNFTNAADELGVGQPAVSRQIHRLETELGVALFVRHPTVGLTDAGRRLQEATRSAFTSIARAVTEIAEVARRPELTIDASIGFASCWLLGRLADFSARNPTVAVRLVTRDLTNLINTEADVIVYHGDGDRATDAELLFLDHLVPVCAADYAGRDRVETAADLAEAPLLGLTAQAHGAGWDRLFAGTGLTAPSIPPERRFTSFIVYREAILKHQGVGHGWLGLMDDDLDAGHLVTVTNLRHTDPRQGYWVSTPTGREDAETFRTWLLQATRTLR